MIGGLGLEDVFGGRKSQGGLTKDSRNETNF
jgi:hypothetical protein